MYFVPLQKRGAKNCKKSAGLQIIRKYDMQPGFFAGFDSLAFPFGEAVGDSRLKRSSPVMSSLGASRHSPRRGKQELRQKLSLPLADFSYRKNQQKLSAASRLPLGGKVPSDSEANEGRDMLSQEESKDSEPREDLTSSVNSVDSPPEGESKNFGRN